MHAKPYFALTFSEALCKALIARDLKSEIFKESPGFKYSRITVEGEYRDFFLPSGNLIEN